MNDDRLAIFLVFAMLLAIVFAQACAGCVPAPAVAHVELEHDDPPALFPAWRSPDANVVAPTFDSRATWCEPIDPVFCSTNADCNAGERCVSPWWIEGQDAKVCARPFPNRAEKRWRSARLRVFVDHVCRRSDGCEPNDLHAYLRLMAMRESSMRPAKRHRLNPDLEASARAWSKHRDAFADNPAAHDPDRWSTGLGYYGQNPAIWLPRWDASAPPETLCGEVEASEAHLRAARDQVDRIHGGVDCDADGSPDFWGTSCGMDGYLSWDRGVDRLPSECDLSWYDISRVNSGTACPGSRAGMLDFEARAARVGLDPWAPVRSEDLGVAISRAGQDQAAAGLRRAMDAVARP